MPLTAHSGGHLHLSVRAHSNLLPSQKQMQVQQTNKSCPDRSHDGYVPPNGLVSAHLREVVVEKWGLWRVPNYLLDALLAARHHNDHLQFLGLPHALDLL